MIDCAGPCASGEGSGDTMDHRGGEVREQESLAPKVPWHHIRASKFKVDRPEGHMDALMVDHIISL